MKYKTIYKTKNLLILILLTISTSLFSQNVAINTSGNTANINAILDLSNTANMGFLAPQIGLSSTILATPLGANVSGMLVYNTTALSAQATSGNSNVEIAPGYYYNNGSGWVRMGPNKFNITLPINSISSADYVALTEEGDYLTNTTVAGNLVGVAPTVTETTGTADDGVLISWISTSTCVLTGVNFWYQNSTGTAETLDIEIVEYNQTAGSTGFKNGTLIASNAAIAIAGNKDFYNPTINLVSPSPIIQSGYFVIVYMKSITDVSFGNITLEFQSMQ